MNTEKIKSMLPMLKKYVPIVLSPRGMKEFGKHMAYTRGYMQGYLIRTGRINEFTDKEGA